MEISDKANVGESYEPAMKITEPDKAKEYFDALVRRNMRVSSHSYDEAVLIEQSNLGYFAGHYDNETRRRVEALFRCRHPVFGAIAKNKPPTPEEAFEMGKRYAMNLKAEKEEEKNPVI